jgi:nucleotide-binding universal stress UspA family protein
MRRTNARTPRTALTPSPRASGARSRSFPPIRRILCPVDFSEFSATAVGRATGLAQALRAEIIALFVIPPLFRSEAATSSGRPAEGIDVGVRSALTEDLHELFRPARDAGVGVRARIRTGESVGQIASEARKTQSGLIVMGTHGRSGLRRLALGSVTEGVLREAPCPVLTMPHRIGRRAARGRVPGWIMCAVDLSARSVHTASYALALARALGSSVSLIHVLEGMGGPRTRARWEADASRRLHEVALADGPPGCPIEEVVGRGRPHEVILRAARVRHADLIVLGTGGQRLGSTVTRVLRAAAFPVLVVRPSSVGRERDKP